MKNNKKLALAVGAAIGGMFMSAGVASADLIGGWNFNNGPTSGGATADTFAPTVGSGTLVFSGVTPQVFGGTTANAANSDVAGAALGLQGGTGEANNGSNLTFTLSTTGYNAPTITYATQRSGTGFSSQDWSYSLDGTNYTEFQNVTSIPSSFGVETVDLSSVVGLQNLTTAYFRVTFTGSTSTSSNNRLDNFQFNANTFGTALPRNLVWDGNGTSAPNPSNTDGTWETSSSWYDGSANQTWNSAGPDNATFGTGAGAGNVTVTLSANETAGSITFAASSPTYTLTGNQLTINGVTGTGITANSNATITSTVDVGSTQTWTVASGKTLTIGDGGNGALTGGGGLIKAGTGSLVLSTPTAYAGAVTINGGEIVVNSADGNARTGLGSGPITVNNGGTLHIDNTTLGANGAGNFTPTITLASGATLLGDGNASITGSGSPTIPVATGTAVSFMTQNASDIFAINSTVRNSNSGTSAATVFVSGPGTIVLGSGATSTAASGTQYTGSWEIDNGMLQIGPLSNNNPGGESINGLGYLASDGPNGPTRPVLINGGLLVGAVNAPSATDTVTVGTIRSNVTLAGGGLGGAIANPTFAGSISLTANSQIQTTDTIDGTSSRTITLGSQTAVSGSQAVPGDLSWGNATLAVNGVGTLRIEKSQGSVVVTPGATIQINNSARLELAGTTDALSDETNNVNVTNNSTAAIGLDVQSAITHNVGNIEGTGSTTVETGATLNAGHILQGSLTISGNAKIREDGSSTGVSNVAALSIPSGGQLDLTNNKLVTNSPVGSLVGTTYTDVTGLIQAGHNGGAWNGSGIITSETAAASPSILTTIGVATGAQVKGLASGATGTWAGQTISDTSTLVMYTYAGDANLDGRINGDDYFAIDSHVNIAGASGYANGDFNLDGHVNGDDYFLIDSNINNQTLGVISTSSGISGGVSAVPEPASIGLLGIAAAGLLRRRRRSC